MAAPIKRHLGRAALICSALTAGIGTSAMALQAPTAWADSLTQPAINGTAQEGQTLTVTHRSWFDSRDYTYQWLRCDSSGEGCLPIAGVTAASYVPAPADVGHALRVQQTRKQFFGHRDTETSAATAAVLPAPATNPAGSAPPPAPPVVVSRAPVTITPRGAAPIGVRCPADAPSVCRGTVTIRLVEAHAKRTGALAARCARGCRPLGSATYEASAGRKVRVRVHIASAGRRLLARRRSLRISVLVTSVSGSSSTTTTLKTTLKA